MSTKQDQTMEELSIVQDNLAVIRENIEKSKADPNQKVTLIAVSKIQSEDKIIQAYRAGQRDFGENYVQELHSKATDSEIQTECPDIRWHMIGHVQTNKINKLLDCPNLSSVQTVDSIKFAKALNEHLLRLKQDSKTSKTLDIFVQVNTSQEEEKSGADISQVTEIVKFVLESCEHLKFCGLMTIGAYGYDTSLGPNPDFTGLTCIRDLVASKLQKTPDSIQLSMGMSSDYQQAIQLGSNFVRVGTSIFGERIRKK